MRANSNTYANFDSDFDSDCHIDGDINVNKNEYAAASADSHRDHIDAR
jgi:subtilase family serine protease